jgi:hypothetical protein
MGTGGNNPNGAFHVGILMMSTDAGKGLRLLVGAKGFSPCFASENAIVAVESLDINTILCSFSFESAFAG